MIRLTFAAATAAFTFAANAQDAPVEGDAEAGERVFRRCQACHIVGEDAKNRVGPMLNDVFGRVPGSLEDFSYSSAMEEYGQAHVWNAETLGAFLASPRDVVPGTKMTFPGLRGEDDIADVLAYLATFDPDGMTVE